MTYQLVGSIGSPYSRKVRLFLHKHKIAHDFKVIDYLKVPADAAYLSSISPTNKIPILYDEGTAIFDSRVIINHLIRKERIKPFSVQEENLQTVIDSCMDSTVNLLFMQMSGTEFAEDHWYRKRQTERIPASMDYLRPWVKALRPDRAEDWNYQSMSLYSYLDWGANRVKPVLFPTDDFAEFLERFRGSPGLKETDFRA